MKNSRKLDSPKRLIIDKKKKRLVNSDSHDNENSDVLVSAVISPYLLTHLHHILQQSEYYAQKDGRKSHAVNDFRKLCNIESYTPTDNVSEFSARINDDGWDSSFSNWLKISRLGKNDAIFIFSVGGGNLKKKVSTNLIQAIKYAKKIKSKVFGIVGRDGGFTKQNGNSVIVIPNIDSKLTTPFAEEYGEDELTNMD